MKETIDEFINANERISEGGIDTAIRYIQRDVAEIKQKLDDKYVTKDEFDPVRKLVYGLVAAILLGVIGAILAMVLRGH